MHGAPARPTRAGQQGMDGPWHQRLRDAVDRGIGHGTVVLYGSHFHLEEASRTPDDDERRHFMGFFWCQVKWTPASDPRACRPGGAAPPRA